MTTKTFKTLAAARRAARKFYDAGAREGTDYIVYDLRARGGEVEEYAFEDAPVPAENLEEAPEEAPEEVLTPAQAPAIALDPLTILEEIMKVHREELGVAKERHRVELDELKARHRDELTTARIVHNIPSAAGKAARENAPPAPRVMADLTRRIIDLASRSQGVTRKELIALTGRDNAPFTQMVQRGEKWGYRYSTSRVDGSPIVYHLTKIEAAPAEAAPVEAPVEAPEGEAVDESGEAA